MKWTLGAVGLLALACSSNDNHGAGGQGGLDGTGGILFSSGSATGSGSSFGIGSGAGPSLTADGGLDALRKSACAGDTERTEPAPSVMELVVDTSGSMNDRAPGTNQSKWQVTHDALKAAIGSLTAQTGVGVLYFPDMNTTPSKPAGDGTDAPRPPTDCVNLNAQVPIDLLGATGAAHRTQVTTSLDAIRAQGGTPTHDAFHAGVQAIEATVLPGSRFIVLITDGQPTFLSGCRGTGSTQEPQDPTPILDDVKAARAAGVRTFVIGSPGSDEVGVPIYSDARQWLSMAASLGGTALPGCSDQGPNFCHFDMTKTTNFSQSLRDVLSQIVGTVLSCSYSLPNPTNGGMLDKSKVNVVFTPKGGKSELIDEAPAGTCTTGWQYSTDQSHVDLCSDTCKMVQAADSPEIDVLFGCSTQVGQVQ